MAICLTPQELQNLTGYALPCDQAAYLDDLGVLYVPRPNGTLGVLRNSIEQRLAHLRRLWREYCDQLNAYEDALDAFEHRTTSMPYPKEPEFPDELRTLTCGAKTRKGTPCKRQDLYPNGRCRMHGGPSTGPITERGKQISALNGFRPTTEIDEAHGSEPIVEK